MTESVINDDTVTEDKDTSVINDDTTVVETDDTDNTAGKTDTKPEDSKTDKDKVDGAPENYADFSMPDGIELDGDLMDKFRDISKSLNLTQDQAQGLIDLQTKPLADKEKADATEWTDLQAEWVKTAKADKEFGGANFDANIGTARKAVEQFGTPELSEMFDTTGTGNHPEILRFLWKVGKAISEDSIRVGQAQNSKVDPASLIYTSHNK